MPDLQGVQRETELKSSGAGETGTSGMGSGEAGNSAKGAAGRNGKTARLRRFRRKARYPGRIAQIGIYLGKFIRMFVYKNDWKVFPISAIIAGLLAYVIRTDFMKTMEGTLKGAFAIACVGLWNGCFNSIQSVCREREIIKREHRSGLHISSYIIAHMIYQALLCLGQTALMLYIFHLVNLRFAAEGFITKWLRVDIGISIFLITYAADMLALLISSLVRSTTDAMTVMPFILIFQLIFSGGVFSLPSWSKPLTQLTITNHGLCCISAQADYNNLPMASAWRALSSMRDRDLEGTVSVGDLLNLLSEEAAAENEVVRELRAMQSDDGRTAGELIDLMRTAPGLEAARAKEYTGSVRIGNIIDLLGEKEVKEAITRNSAEASQNPNYERSRENIYGCWATLAFYALLYAFAAIISLEFIDQDKR